MPVLSRRSAFKIGAIVFGLVVGLLVAEIALRLVGYSRPEFYQPSPTLGVELIPNMRGWYSKEGRSWVEINSDGQRDIERTIAKPSDTVRIGVVGDSYVEGFQVGADERFTRYLEDTARSCGGFSGKKVEVLPFGASGYSTAQELLLAREKIWKYQPDILLLLVTTNNDITDNLRFFKSTAIPYLVLRDGRLELDDSFKNDRGFIARSSSISSAGRWVVNNLRVAQGVGEISSVLRKKMRGGDMTQTQPIKPTNRQQEDVKPLGDVGIDNQIYRSPADQNWEEAWSVTEAVLSVFDDEARDKGAKFFVVTGSNGVQVSPDPKLRELFAKRLRIGDLVYPDRRIREFGQRESIPVITLVDDLALYAERSGAYLHGFGDDIGNGHWNQLGHRVAGELIGQKMCEQLGQ